MCKTAKGCAARPVSRAEVTLHSGWKDAGFAGARWPVAAFPGVRLQRGGKKAEVVNHGGGAGFTSGLLDDGYGQRDDRAEDH